VKAAMTSRQPKKKRSHKLKDAREIQAEAIVAEMKGLDIGRTELPIVKKTASGELCVLEPIQVQRLAHEHKWTAQLPLFTEAKQSSIDAIIRLTAETQALRCSYNVDSPRIEQTLFQIRAGLIALDDVRIAQLVRYAQKIGKGREIHRQIDAALHDAERRKNDGTPSPDLNRFRLTIAYLWTGFLFWLMSDENIVNFMATNALAPRSFNYNRATVTKARNQLGLVKSKRLLVKSVGRKFQWIFVAGYPPT